jgi:hypothetical protein
MMPPEGVPYLRDCMIVIQYRKGTYGRCYLEVNLKPIDLAIGAYGEGVHRYLYWSKCQLR